MENKNHIRRPDESAKNKSYCGIALTSFDWCFQNVDHALLTIEQEGSIAPCKDCLESIQRIISKGQEVRNG